jgi:predicted flap endonuclease-1-like 5' DNA nuclease
MKKYTDVIMGGFVLWCLGATYWYTIVHNKLNFANHSEIIDNHILEILFIIITSFLLGYLLHKSIFLAPTKEKIVETNKTGTPAPTGPKKVNRSSVKDDLKVVEGIGPAIEKLLNKEGINTYWQLAETTETQLLSILTKAGPLYLNHGESTWGEQATLLRDGKIEEFKTLAAQLIGGNRVA